MRVQETRNRIIVTVLIVVGMDSSVGMATCYGLVGPGIESRCVFGGGGRSEIFRTRLKPTVETRQPTWVPDLFRGGIHPPPFSVGVK
jgi:hypothetical protein